MYPTDNSLFHLKFDSPIMAANGSVWEAGLSVNQTHAVKFKTNNVPQSGLLLTVNSNQTFNINGGNATKILLYINKLSNGLLWHKL